MTGGYVAAPTLGRCGTGSCLAVKSRVMRNTRTVSISLTPEQDQCAERPAKRQCRTISELFLEGLRRLEEEDRKPIADRGDFGTLLRLVHESARQAGLDKMTKPEIDAEIEVVRKQKHKHGRMTSRRRVPDNQRNDPISQIRIGSTKASVSHRERRPSIC